MQRIVWDETGKRLYETGVKQGVLYPMQSNGAFGKGVAWNGLTALTESPSGAEASPIYADDIKYLNLISTEEFGATIEAYTYPDDFGLCDGTIEIKPGINIGQQSRRTFGLSYKTALGNDTDGTDYGYKLHLIYGALAAPSEKAYSTVNDSPEAVTFSWEITTTPVSVKGNKPTASLTIDSTKVDPVKLKTLEAILYGSEILEARLPLPDEIATIFDGGAPVALTVTPTPADNATAVVVSTPIKLTFNNKIATENIVVMSADGTIVQVTKSTDPTGKIITITANTTWFANTLHLVSLVGVTDINGQALANKVIKFKTA